MFQILVGSLQYYPRFPLCRSSAILPFVEKGVQPVERCGLLYKRVNYGGYLNQEIVSGFWSYDHTPPLRRAFQWPRNCVEVLQAVPDTDRHGMILMPELA